MHDNHVKAFGFGLAHHALEGGTQIGLGRATRFLKDLHQVPAAPGGQVRALVALGVQAPAFDLFFA